MKHDSLHQQEITPEQLTMLLREEGIEYLSEVRRAYLEPSGQLSVYKEKNNKRKMDSILPKA